MIPSVCSQRTNAELIAHIQPLWISPTATVLDVTWGRGKFWDIWHPQHLIAHDKYTLDGVDFRNLPEDDLSMDVVVFDPVYCLKGGRTTSGIPEMDNRYWMNDGPKTLEGLQELIAGGLVECARVLKPKGILLVKCMDQISSGKFVKGRHFVVEAALKCGLQQVDEVIHVTGGGPQPLGRRQVHTRRVHSFLEVFQKPLMSRPNTVM